MQQKRKISIRKIIQVSLTLVVSVCCVVAMVSASKTEDRKLLTSISVHIKNDKKYHFIEQKDVMEKALVGLNPDLMETPIGKLDMNRMEQNIKADPWVAEAQVYIDNDKILHIYVSQRIPIARFFDTSGASYYIDGTLHVMPLSPNYIYYTSVVTNVPLVTNDTAWMAVKGQIAFVVKTIQADSFWSLQTSQIVFDSAGAFELVPIIGNQRIILGDTSHLKEKLDNLLSFYKNILNKVGWDKYETLDLRFRGQVVASPSLPYKEPADKDNLSWVKSIEETGAREVTRDSVKKEKIKSEKVNTTAKDKAPKIAGTKALTTKDKLKQPPAGKLNTKAPVNVKSAISKIADAKDKKLKPTEKYVYKNTKVVSADKGNAKQKIADTKSQGTKKPLVVGKSIVKGQKLTISGKDKTNQKAADTKPNDNKKTLPTNQQKKDNTEKSKTATDPKVKDNKKPPPKIFTGKKEEVNKDK